MQNSNSENPNTDCETEPSYLDEKQVAFRLGVSKKWLQKMRRIGGGIPFHKFGASVRYAMTDILDFELGSRRASTSDLGQSPLYTHSKSNNGENREDRRGISEATASSAKSGGDNR